MVETEYGKLTEVVCVGLVSDVCYGLRVDWYGLWGQAFSQWAWIGPSNKDVCGYGWVDFMQTTCQPCTHNQQAACKPIAEFTGRLFGMKRMYWFTNG